MTDLINKYGADLALKLQAIDCPDFLAYFQHSFDLEPSFKKYYVTDASVMMIYANVILIKKKIFLYIGSVSSILHSLLMTMIRRLRKLNKKIKQKER